MNTQDEMRKLADKLEALGLRLSEAATRLPDIEKFEELVKDPANASLAEVQMATELVRACFDGMDAADGALTRAKHMRLVADDLEKKGL